MTKKFDLEDRTLHFSKDVFRFVKILPEMPTNREVTRQLIRSAGSIGANYREANEGLGHKDFLMKVRVARREAKETIYWLELTECREAELGEKARLVDEATQIMKILGAIAWKFERGRQKKLEGN